MNFFKKLKNHYVNWHAGRFEIPIFDPSNIVRKKVSFTGIVQNVGFRWEVYHLAQRLELTGWVKNLNDGSVEAELQGEEGKIQFLVKCMQSLKRASVEKVTFDDVLMNEDEEDFTIMG